MVRKELFHRIKLVEHKSYTNRIDKSVHKYYALFPMRFPKSVIHACLHTFNVSILTFHNYVNMMCIVVFESLVVSLALRA